jgi:hypothetical protein
VIVRICVFAACLLALTGCGVSSSDEPNASRSDNCRQGPAEPVSVAMTLEVLRGHGYDMTSVDSNTACTLDRIVAYITNAPDTSQSPSENVEALGHVICHVEAKDIFLKSAFDVRPHTDKVIVYAENVRCTIYPRGDHQDEQVDTLKTAMMELAEPAKPVGETGETTP